MKPKSYDPEQHYVVSPDRSVRPRTRNDHPDVIETTDRVFNPQTEAEIRLQATSLRCLRKKLQDGSIDVSNFDSFQQLKLFQDILRQDEERKLKKKKLRNEPLERVKDFGKPKFHTPPPPSVPPPTVQRRKSRHIKPQNSIEISEFGDFRASNLYVPSLSGMPSLVTLHCDEMNGRGNRNVTASRMSMLSSNTSYYYPEHQVITSHLRRPPYLQHDVTASLQSVAKRQLNKSATSRVTSLHDQQQRRSHSQPPPKYVPPPEYRPRNSSNNVVERRHKSSLQRQSAISYDDSQNNSFLQGFSVSDFGSESYV